MVISSHLNGLFTLKKKHILCVQHFIYADIITHKDTLSMWILNIGLVKYLRSQYVSYLVVSFVHFCYLLTLLYVFYFKIFVVDICFMLIYMSILELSHICFTAHIDLLYILFWCIWRSPNSFSCIMTYCVFRINHIDLFSPVCLIYRFSLPHVESYLYESVALPLPLTEACMIVDIYLPLLYSNEISEYVVKFTYK